MQSAENALDQLRAARADAERLNTEYRQAMTRVFGRAALACRRGGDIEAVLAEVQQLLPGPRTQGAPLVDVVAAGATRKAVVKDLVKTWYQPLPEDVRHDWSNHAIAGDHGCATALEKLTGIKADTVRTEYLTEIRREIGDDPRRPDFDGLTHSPRGHDRSRICCRRGRSRRLSEAGGEQQREEHRDGGSRGDRRHQVPAAGGAVRPGGASWTTRPSSRTHRTGTAACTWECTAQSERHHPYAPRRTPTSVEAGSLIELYEDFSSMPVTALSLPAGTVVLAGAWRSGALHLLRPARPTPVPVRWLGGLSEPAMDREQWLRLLQTVDEAGGPDAVRTHRRPRSGLHDGEAHRAGTVRCGVGVEGLAHPDHLRLGQDIRRPGRTAARRPPPADPPTAGSARRWAVLRVPRRRRAEAWCGSESAHEHH